MKFRFPLKALLAGAGVVAIAMMAVACGGDDGEETTGAAVKTPGGAGTAATAGGGTPSGDTGGQSITVLLKDNLYEPKNFKVPVNKTVTILLKNEGAVIHNFHVLSKKNEGKDFQSDPIIAAKTESKMTVKFTKKGKVNFQCDYHVPDMVGTITVE